MKKTLILALCVALAGCGKVSEKAHEEAEHHEEAVHLKEESQKLVGIERAAAKKGFFKKIIEVSGEIAQDTEDATHVTSPEEGILKEYLVKVGDVVEKDAPLLVVDKKSGQIKIVSPSHGIVLARYSKEGGRLDTLSSILTIANPDVMRASFNVYEKDLAILSMGQKIGVKTVAYPDKAFDGEVVFISPRVDPDTRTIKVRANIENKDHFLKLGMFVTGQIEAPSDKESLFIPISAVQAVEGKMVVFVPQKDEPDEFLMREIITGEKSDKEIEVREGLSENEEIIAKGSFYLKSELLKGELEEGHAH